MELKRLLSVLNPQKRKKLQLINCTEFCGSFYVKGHQFRDIWNTAHCVVDKGQYTLQTKKEYTFVIFTVHLILRSQRDIAGAIQRSSAFISF